MSARFEEIDWRPTAMGDISLRRRRDPVSGIDVYEVKLGDEFLMSSLFTAGEIALTELGLAELPDVDPEAEPEAELDVVVGGLGLGYTAVAALDDPRVRSLTVIDTLAEVIDWHRRGLVPLGARLSSDPRCRLVQGDFFAMAADSRGLDPEEPGRRFHAVLLDVDHSPRHVLHPRHAALYQPAGLRALAEHLHPGGVFALWSNDPPDEQFTSVLAEVFPRSAAHVVDFDNPLQGGTSTNTVYVARTEP
ncbi:spermidine synthase [Streptomyces umbrinus]|uniref:spermidine synthase n=1 Tax=Streptomyces umbrinus TaxID=67370 RepID=UPI00167CDDC7|nr:spermidine synthase [Streptomyces umbrinus]MCR3724822.1 spermidine synthase [Streptomyces umbrinus]GHH60764.1 spermidine synthase [Streptomyces umbrinus]